MLPSSRRASSLKPNVAYLVLNFCALWKKQTILPSLAYAGIPYQSFGERVGALALTTAWIRLAMARSDSDSSAIFASTAPSSSPRRDATFCSWTRACIAAFSSAVNPSYLVLDAGLLLVAFRLSFIGGLLPGEWCWERPHARVRALRRLLENCSIAASGGQSGHPAIRLADVLVVAAPPHAGLVATERRAVQPLVHAPEAVYPALVRRVGVVDDAILERKRAHAGPFAPVGRPVCPNARGERGDERILLAALEQSKVRRAEVVLGGSRLPLLLGDRHLVVVVEVAAERRRPGETPAHPLLVRLQFRERCSRHRAERDVVIREVGDRAVEAVRDRRAGRTPCLVVGPEHEVVDEELRASSEEIGE